MIHKIFCWFGFHKYETVLSSRGFTRDYDNLCYIGAIVKRTRACKHCGKVKWITEIEV